MNVVQISIREFIKQQQKKSFVYSSDSGGISKVL